MLIIPKLNTNSCGSPLTAFPQFDKCLIIITLCLQASTRKRRFQEKKCFIPFLALRQTMPVTAALKEGNCANYSQSGRKPAKTSYKHQWD